MHIAVLAASGATGFQLTMQALNRGHTVTAIARSPVSESFPHSHRLRHIIGDVHDSNAVVRALQGTDGVVSGLGVTPRSDPGTLTVGAKAVIESGMTNMIWLGAFGTGQSAGAAGLFASSILRFILGSEIADKEAADAAILGAMGTVFHAGPLTNGPLISDYRVLALSDVPRRALPASISRSTVASAMLDEIEGDTRRGVLVPLGPPRSRNSSRSRA